jgi:hypothetical protein
MHTTIEELAPAELRVLARLRLDVAAHLAAEAARVDPSLLGAKPRPFVLKLVCPGLPPAFVASTGAGAPVAFSGGARPSRGAPSLTLRFLGPAACARVLMGGGGSPIPVPRGPGAGAALAYFRAAAPRAAGLISDATVPAAARARLLAVAALRGVAAVGSADPALDERLAHMPDGSVSVSAPDAFSLGIVKRGRTLTALDAAPERPSARLTFADAGSALAVLSGKRTAVVALGAGEVTVAGLLPLVQGMFGVLDRVSQYLGVSARREAAR